MSSNATTVGAGVQLLTKATPLIARFQIGTAINTMMQTTAAGDKRRVRHTERRPTDWR